MAKFRVAELSRKLPGSDLSSSELTRRRNWLMLLVALMGKAADRATALEILNGDSDHVTI